MPQSHSIDGNSEAARIRREYERRDRSIPPDFYAADKAANRFAQGRLAARIRTLFEQHRLTPLAGRRIADIGCGLGTWLSVFATWGAHPRDLFGIDLSQRRVATARQRLPHSEIVHGDASRLPWPDVSFDLTCQFTAFSSVLDGPMKKRMAAEMLRVLRPGGAILWYDLRINNPRNPAVRAISLEEITALFPGCAMEAERQTLAPPLARAIAPRSETVASFLERIPALRSHNLVWIGKPE
ncbi:MAG TPA: class I SAM-dependent methyltransferase [Bryobacteraceae bacterium]|nr:class I SAM-dependent methyltransferase [Bryobacteraceae bacterium]